METVVILLILSLISSQSTQVFLYFPSLGLLDHCVIPSINFICHNPPSYSRYMWALQFSRLVRYLRLLSFLSLEWLLPYFRLFHICFQLYWHCSSRYISFNFRPRKFESPEWFNPFSDHVLSMKGSIFRQWRRSLPPITSTLCKLETNFQ